MIVNDLILHPYKQLLEELKVLKKPIKSFFLIGHFQSTFSWVYDINDDNIIQFTERYQLIKTEIRNQIEITDNKFLKNKLKDEFQLFPILKKEEYIIDINNPFAIFLTKFRFLKKIRKTLKFKDEISEIEIITNRMINFIKNPEWIELEIKTAANIG